MFSFESQPDVLKFEWQLVTGVGHDSLTTDGLFTLRNRTILMNLSRGIKTPTPPYIGLKISHRIWTIHRNDTFGHRIRDNSRIRDRMTCLYTVRKKKCSSFFWYKAIIVWFSQFIMTVVQNEATLSEKRRPGTGSSPKTADSQSVKEVH